MRDFKIGKSTVGPSRPPLIVAEMSGNHNQSLERALALVDAAAAAGAHAIKLQTYTAETMTIDSRKPSFMVDSDNPLWEGESLYDLYAKAHTPWAWHKTLFKRAKEKGIAAFSSPFDVTAVDLLESLGAPAYKIASFENTDWPLLRKVAKTGKPVIVSTGMAELSDIDEAVRVLREAGCRDLVLLKCTSSYPASPKDSHVRTLAHLAAAFGCHVGLSDHTMGIGAAVASVAFGACLIEKHFTLSRTDGGVDSAFSMEPRELKSLVVESKRAFEALGEIKYGATETDRHNRRFRRSVYVVKDMKVSEKFTAKNVRVIRPGDGLEPRYYDLVLGKRCARPLKRGTPLSWAHLVGS